MAEEKKTTAKRKRKVEVTPLMTSTAATGAVESTRVRRNISSQIENLNRFSNIHDGLIPFQNSGSISSSSSLTVRDAVVLCQKCYYNFAVFRNVIDLMTEFSIGSLYFTGGTKRSRDFFSALFNKINIEQFQDKFFREYYRSGNVFVYRFEGKINNNDVTRLSRLFSSADWDDNGLTKISPAPTEDVGEPPNVTDMVVPVRYLILNPADVQMEGSSSFAEGRYSKIITDYELERLRKPYTEEDKDVFNGLDSKTRKAISNKRATHILLPLDPEKYVAIFYKKQDYEPFSVPMGYPVLDDINFKSEMKKMDMALLRTMQQCILLVTMGAEPDKGGVNQRNLAAMQTLFANESVGRVLISDYTTKAEFVIPKVADLLDPKKYEVIDNDINLGLNNILFGGEKFANQASKTDVFIKRLNQGRNTFLSEFIIPEMKRITKSLGFKKMPEPHFDKVLLKDAFQMGRLWNQLAQFGLLSPEEVIQAHNTGRLPDAEESEVSQERYKKLRDKGFYEPVVGGPNTQKEIVDKQGEMQLELSDKTGEQQIKLADKNAKTQEKLADKKTKEPNKPNGGARPAAKPKEPKGRPPGTSSPQTTKTYSPPGEGPQSKPATERAAAEIYFSLDKVKDNLVLANNLQKEVEKELRKLHNIKRLNKIQKKMAEDIVELIVSSEASEDWINKAKEYCKNPISNTSVDILNEVTDIAYNHQVDTYLASILRASKKEKD